VRSDPIRDAADAVRGGALIVLPSDTVYGIGSRPDDPAATARVFEAKQRSRDLELPVLCATEAQARRIASFDARADALAHACWPGGLTLVLARARASRGWELGGDPETVGLRVPSHPLARAVLSITGPMAVTSANRSGSPPVGTCDELVATFGDQVAVYLCAPEPLTGVASTVLDLAHGPASIIRYGSVERATIRGTLPPGIPLLDSRPSS
jgi:L-threonylcarbamoyladenylate synthase